MSVQGRGDGAKISICGSRRSFFYVNFGDFVILWGFFFQRVWYNTTGTIFQVMKTDLDASNLVPKSA